MTTDAPSDSLRDVYERRAELEYADLVSPDPTVDRKFAVVTEELGRHLPARAFLDTGCGDGRYLAALPALGAVPPRVVGTDIAARMLETTARAAEHAGVHPELVRANLERLPFADREFDLVLCVQVIEHLLDPSAGIRELARVLCPGGTLILTTDNTWALMTRMLNAPRWTTSWILGARRSRVLISFPHSHFKRRRLTRLLEEAGLSIVRTRTFRFSLVGSSERLRRTFSRIDAHLPDLGIGDILLVVARRLPDR
jgi:ubiquinone/menaquinone biosynthesis C-methylase UbiE